MITKDNADLLLHKVTTAPYLHNGWNQWVESRSPHFHTAEMGVPLISCRSDMPSHKRFREGLALLCNSLAQLHLGQPREDYRSYLQEKNVVEITVSHSVSTLNTQIWQNKKQKLWWRLPKYSKFKFSLSTAVSVYLLFPILPVYKINILFNF